MSPVRYRTQLRPLVALRQRDHAAANNPTGRAELFTNLLAEIGSDMTATPP